MQFTMALNQGYWCKIDNNPTNPRAFSYRSTLLRDLALLLPSPSQETSVENEFDGRWCRELWATIEDNPSEPGIDNIKEHGIQLYNAFTPVPRPTAPCPASRSPHGTR